jgi:hypothetical protein
MTVQSSWNAPWLRKLAMKSFSDLDCLRIGHAVELRLFRAVRPFHGTAELQ